MLVQNEEASELYIKRYIDFFPYNCLKGKKLGIYQHSATGRDMMVRIFSSLGADIESGGKILKALPTRDAIILHLAILLLSIRKNRKISELLAELPQRFTASNRLKDFPTDISRA